MVQPFTHERPHHGLDAEDVERPPEFVDECREAELSPDIVETLHQKGALVHPLLVASEGMLDELATAVEDFRPRLWAGGHPVKHLSVRRGAMVRRLRPDVRIALLRGNVETRLAKVAPRARAPPRCSRLPG